MKLKFSSNQKDLRVKLLTILNDAHTSHIGSCLSVIDIIDTVYKLKKNNEKFVLSNGHSAAALYVVLEKYGYIEKANLSELNVHPDRDAQKGIDLSTGSLGQGLPIAVGMALANKKKNVYCLISDGECAEGSIWEALRIVQEQNIDNLKIIVSVNGWGAYDPINSKLLQKRLKGFGFNIKKVNGHDQKQLKLALKAKHSKLSLIVAETVSDQFPFLVGQDAHYYTMNNQDFNLAMKELT